MITVVPEGHLVWRCVLLFVWMGEGRIGLWD